MLPLNYLRQLYLYCTAGVPSQTSHVQKKMFVPTFFQLFLLLYFVHDLFIYLLHNLTLNMNRCLNVFNFGRITIT